MYAQPIEVRSYLAANDRRLASQPWSKRASACVKFAAVIASFLGRVQITSLPYVAASRFCQTLYVFML